MPRDMKEPQSYGSEADWVTGHTGQQPNDPKAEAPASQQEFYSDERESDTSAEHQGGKVSDVQKNEAAVDATAADITDTDRRHQHPGDLRGSYFKDRDYPE